ncbi:MAG TPA: phosphatidate cytidylyltransferase [Pyrinomonadaceae bacterium]|nr:phosphatidate cytidylyltransferase [Pyrinomonadaceae bacterium]
MKTRILTAAVALPLLIAAIVLPKYLPGTEWVFVIIAVIAILAGLFEFYSLTKKLELKADASVGYLIAAALVVAFIFDAPGRAPDLLLLTIAAAVIITLITQTFRFRPDFSKMAAGTAVTLLGVFYVVFLGGFLVSVRIGFDYPQNLSSHLLGFYFLVIMGADTGAYFAGRFFGRHKLAPRISPGKTIEGLIAGLASAALAAFIANRTFFQELILWHGILLAVIMAAVSVLGDLAESALKRGSGEKDAATFLPGHGGLLDRLDSLLFNAPILYYFARYYFGQ